jgi:hypothetical protein
MNNDNMHKDDAEYQAQLRMIQSSLEQKASVFTPPPQHPVVAPINLGRHDPKLKHVNDKSRT